MYKDSLLDMVRECVVDTAVAHESRPGKAEDAELARIELQEMAQEKALVEARKYRLELAVEQVRLLVYI